MKKGSVPQANWAQAQDLVAHHVQFVHVAAAGAAAAAARELKHAAREVEQELAQVVAAALEAGTVGAGQQGDQGAAAACGRSGQGSVKAGR